MIETILTPVLKQLANQKVTDPEAIARFTIAYSATRDIVGNGEKGTRGAQNAIAWENLIKMFLKEVDPRNKYYREIPVTFSSGTTRAVDHWEIPRLMGNLCEAIDNQSITPDEAYQEFERIHPGIDGNGRVGHILWCILKTEQDNIWPDDEMPPEYKE